MKKLTLIVVGMLIWNGQVLAASNCDTITITANTPTTAFVDHGDGTVTHAKTGLMWKKCAEGLDGATCTTGMATTHTWQAALQLVETLNNGGGFATYNDWRVPNLKELHSIVERQCIGPAINAAIFPATASSQYWSASPYAGSDTQAWHVNFNSGLDFISGKDTSHYVRLVRLVRVVGSGF